MLKLVGTEGHDIVDEKIIIDDNNKITSFGIKLLLIDVVLDMCLFMLISRVMKSMKTQ